MAGTTSLAGGVADRPPSDLLRELKEILASEPTLAGLVQPQPDEPAMPRHVLLRSRPSPYYLVEVVVPDRRGRIWASRLPGRHPSLARDEVLALRRFGIDRIVCLVPPAQLEGLHGAYTYLPEVRSAYASRFQELPILDHQVPPDDELFERSVEQVATALEAGEQVLVHCVGGCGRTGLFAACVMVLAGIEPREAIRSFRRQRRCGPETPEQVAYVVRYARRRDSGLTRGAAAPGTPGPRVSISHSRGRPVHLARGGAATLFVGRLHLGAGRARRVAVKRFRSPLATPAARCLQRCIRQLHASGVALPKMGVLELPSGEWVQVTPLFGSTGGGSKLCQPSLFFRSLAAEDKCFAVDQLTRVADAGYRPCVDLFVVFRDRRKGIVPLDLDLIAEEMSVERAAAELLKQIVQIGADAEQRDRLLEAARAVASPVLKAAIDRHLSEGSPYRRLWHLT